MARGTAAGVATVGSAVVGRITAAAIGCSCT